MTLAMVMMMMMMMKSTDQHDGGYYVQRARDAGRGGSGSGDAGNMYGTHQESAGRSNTPYIYIYIYKVTYWGDY